MGYNFFSSLNDDLDFPPEIRSQLTKSFELRNLVVPMTRAVRDNLKFNERWNGRVIYNTTTKSLETWRAESNKWVYCLDVDTVPPDPTPPWSSNYTLPQEVRTKLVSHSEFLDQITPMSQTDRNNLGVDSKWNNRIIYNTTTKRLERWDVTQNDWLFYFDSTSVLPDLTEKGNWPFDIYDPENKYQDRVPFYITNSRSYYFHKPNLNFIGFECWVEFHLSYEGSTYTEPLTDDPIRFTIPNPQNNTVDDFSGFGTLRLIFNDFNSETPFYHTVGIATVENGNSFFTIEYRRPDGKLYSLNENVFETVLDPSMDSLRTLYFVGSCRYSSM